MHALAQAAHRYADAGLSPLPTTRKGDAKGPALPSWKRMQSAIASHEELDRWYADGSTANSVGIVCGAVSGNLEMIDFDLGGAAYERWRNVVEDAAPGLVRRLVIETTPSGGRHAIYRCADSVGGNVKLAAKRFEADDATPLWIGAKEYVPRQDRAGKWHCTVTTIETRGEGGMFLCAPSEGYEIVQNDIAEPPIVTTEERDIMLGAAWSLDESGQREAVGTNPTAHDGSTIRPGDDYNARGDPRDALRRNGWVMVRGGENEHWRRPGKTSGTSATVKDRVLYVFSSNAAPFEPSTAYSPFAVVAMLDHGGDFATTAKALASDGYGQRSMVAGVDLSAFSFDAAATIDDEAHETPCFDDIAERHPFLREPIIDGLLRVGETMNVIAAPKTGKSWLVNDLALSIVTGKPWLTRHAVNRGRVLILDNELHPETTAKRIPIVADARGIDRSAYGRELFVENFRGQLRDIRRLGTFFASIEPGRYKVVILDAFYRFMPPNSDENDNAGMAAIYNLIDHYADMLQCSFVLVHHASKGNQSGKGVTDIGAGAGSQSRATDTHLVLRQHEEEGVVVMDAAVRSWPPIAPVCLRWEFPCWYVDGSHDPAALEGRAKGRPQSVTMTPEDFIAAVVTDEPMTRAEVIDRAVDAGLSRRLADDLLRICHKRLMIARSGSGSRGVPYVFSRL